MMKVTALIFFDNFELGGSAVDNDDSNSKFYDDMPQLIIQPRDDNDSSVDSNEDDQDEDQVEVGDKDAAEQAEPTTNPAPVYNCDPYNTDTDQEINDGDSKSSSDTNMNELCDGYRWATNEVEALIQQLDNILDFDDTIDESAAWRAALTLMLNEEKENMLNEEKESKSNEDGDEDELGGAATTPQSLNDLHHSEYWIGDTGDTTHFTPIQDGMINLRTPKGENVVMGNGNAAKASMIGDVAGTLISKYGVELHPVTLSNTTYSKEAKFNLFSLTMMMKKGWKLTGNVDNLTLTKEDKKTVFDIKVLTPKGIIFVFAFGVTIMRELCWQAIVRKCCLVLRLIRSLGTWMRKEQEHQQSI